jgi:hypothetical protein
MATTIPTEKQYLTTEDRDSAQQAAVVTGSDGTTRRVEPDRPRAASRLQYVPPQSPRSVDLAKTLTPLSMPPSFVWSHLAPSVVPVPEPIPDDEPQPVPEPEPEPEPEPANNPHAWKLNH